MEYVHRTAEPLCRELLDHFPILAILGARQVGKSTLVQELGIADLKTVTFDPVQDIQNARQDPDFFMQNQTTPLFLDEIQYAPELLGSLKRLVDKNRTPGQFVLSGSQNLSVLKSITESLAGRVAIFHLLPLSQSEMRGEPVPGGVIHHLLSDSAFSSRTFNATPAPSTFEAVWRGGMPGLLELPAHLYQRYFDSYRQTYIERDVRTTANIGSLQTFGRFFGLLAALTACEINHNQLGRQLGIDRKTAVAWTEIATATFQWIQIPAYSRNAVKRIAGKPKGYFVDTGFSCHLQHITTPAALAANPIQGQLFETYVVLEILKQLRCLPSPPAVHHFRSHSQAEVDLIIEQDGCLYPIEIKMKAHPARRDCRGIHYLAECFPNSRIGTGLIICACESVRKIDDNIYAVPWWEI